MIAYPLCLQATAYDVPLEVRSDDEALLNRARNYLPFGSELTTGGISVVDPFILLSQTINKPYRLRRGGRILFRHSHPEVVLNRLRSLLTLHTAENARKVFIHAGVVGWNGRAILLPGRSFAGKTTLTSELVRAGAIYYSDDYAVVDAQGLIHPYDQDLQIRLPGSAKQVATPVTAFDGESGTQPLRLSLVVFTHFRPGSVWNPELLSPGQAALELMRHTVSARRDPARVMKILGRLADGATAVSSPRDEASAIALAILRLFSLYEA